MAPEFVNRSGKACGVLRWIITREELGDSKWSPNSFGPRGSKWQRALPALLTNFTLRAHKDVVYWRVTR